MIDFGSESKKEENDTEASFNTEIEKLDAGLDREHEAINKVNGSTNRTDNSVMLQVHIDETRKLIIALREQLALCEMYRERMK